MGFTLARRSPAKRARRNKAPARNRTRRPVLRVPPRLATRSLTRVKSKLNAPTTSIHRDGPVSQSFYRWKRIGRPVRLGALQKLTAPCNFITNQTIRFPAPIGKQYTGTGTFPSLYSVVDLNNIFANVVTQQSTSSAVTASNSTIKWFNASCKMELMLTNQSNDVVNVKIYECVARKDITNSSYWSPGQAWAQGDIDAGSVTTLQVIGGNPFQSPAFVKLWKVEKVINFDLHTGGHHMHRSICTPKRMFSVEQLNSVGTSQAAIGGLTRVTMVVIHGYPINDSVTNTQISTAAANVDMIWSKQYEFRSVSTNEVIHTQNNVLPTSFTVGGQLMDDLKASVVASVSA